MRKRVRHSRRDGAQLVSLWLAWGQVGEGTQVVRMLCINKQDC